MPAVKMRLEDVPAAIEQVLWRCRQGLRLARDHQILQVLEPETIDLNFEVMVRKDDLERVETSERGPSTTTSVTGDSTSTSVRVGGGSTTDSTETSTTDDSSTTDGDEHSSEAGEDFGTDMATDSSIDGGTSETFGGHSSLDSGLNVETISYETDSGGP